MELMLILLAMQGVAVAAPPAEPSPTGHAQPDLEIVGKARVESMRIERDGSASVVLDAEPAHSDDTIEIWRSQPGGQDVYSDFEISIHAEVRIADPVMAELAQPRLPDMIASTSEGENQPDNEESPE